MPVYEDDETVAAPVDCPECGGPLLTVKILSGTLDAPSGVIAYDCLRCGSLLHGGGVSEDIAAWFDLRNTERRARMATHGLESMQAEILEMIAGLAREFKRLREAENGRRLLLGPRVNGRPK